MKLTALEKELVEALQELGYHAELVNSGTYTAPSALLADSLKKGFEALKNADAHEAECEGDKNATCGDERCQKCCTHTYYHECVGRANICFECGYRKSE